MQFLETEKKRFGITNDLPTDGIVLKRIQDLNVELFRMDDQTTDLGMNDNQKTRYEALKLEPDFDACELSDFASVLYNHDKRAIARHTYRRRFYDPKKSLYAQIKMNE